MEEGGGGRRKEVKMNHVVFTHIHMHIHMPYLAELPSQK
jgi:hypothetical protein